LTKLCIQLQVLFCKLQYSTLQFINPSEFTNSIGLKAAVQQDPGEFFKLFIAFLEESDTLLRDLIVSQFQGSIKYITTCDNCSKCSESPCKFYELELSIKGNSTIEDCLAQYIKEEKLTGSNQFMCSNCDKKQDVRRAISLCEFPEVLNLQLLRFEYDMNTGKKKKLKTNIRCPKVLDMKPFVTEKMDDIPSYELSGILIHKGTSAYGGHYIAHLKDEVNNQWWIFDDTSVKPIQTEQLEQTLEQEEEQETITTTDSKKQKKEKEGYSTKFNWKL